MRVQRKYKSIKVTEEAKEKLEFLRLKKQKEMKGVFYSLSDIILILIKRFNDEK